MWVPFFNRRSSAVKIVIDELLDDDRAMRVGPIVTEILQGLGEMPKRIGSHRCFAECISWS